jgi:hypothetical protein
LGRHRGEERGVTIDHGRTELGQADDPERAPAFTVDTVADKAVRFGCGAILALLVLLALGMVGFMEPFGIPAVIAICLMVVAASGVLSVAFGEPFIRSLLKLIDWFA